MTAREKLTDGGPLDVVLIDVGVRLSAARLQRDLSQGTVASRAGIAASYLSRVENGKIQPTFRTVLRILHAMRADLSDITGPESRKGERQGACPVTSRGHCLLDLIHLESASKADQNDEHFTPREVRLLRTFARWMKRVPADRIRAMEILLGDLMRDTVKGSDSA